MNFLLPFTSLIVSPGRTLGGSLAITSCLLLCATACSVDGTAGVEGTEPSEETALEGEDAPIPFASFETEDGSTVQFFEPAPGELLVTAIAKIDSPAFELGKPAALYEKLAGEPLPERFSAALEGAGSSDDAESAEFDSGSPATPDLRPQAITQEDLTTEEYAAEHCNKGKEMWCWLERTNTSYFSQRVGNMGADAYAYRGTITHELRRKNTWGNWKTLYSSAVPAGYRSHAYSSTVIEYTHESRVDDASGDGYHHSGYRW